MDLIKYRQLNLLFFGFLYLNIAIICKVIENYIEFSQVSCEYYLQNGACIPIRVHTLIISVQHSEKIDLEDLKKEIMTKIVKTVIPSQYLDDKTIFHINPCGQFVIGGPLVSIIAYLIITT